MSGDAYSLGFDVRKVQDVNPKVGEYEDGKISRGRTECYNIGKPPTPFPFSLLGSSSTPDVREL